MLVLAQKLNGEIIIDTSDGPIVIRLLEIRRDKARVGVTAPKKIPVFRAETYAKIHGPEALREIKALTMAG